MRDYGKELILDLHNCDTSLFNRRDLKGFFRDLCSLIDMEAEKLVWWDDTYVLKEYKETDPHLVGTSAVQFIRTSNITIHTLDKLEKVFINIFSCKDFNSQWVKKYCKDFFRGKVVSFTVIKRR